MANEITTLINIPSAEVASKTFVASNYMPLAGGKFTGAVNFPYRAITALTTLDNTDYTIDCTANSFTVTLPTAVGITGRIYNIKNSGRIIRKIIYTLHPHPDLNLRLRGDGFNS